MENKLLETRCSFCNKELDEWDKQQNFKIDFCGMYGSSHDGERIKVHLCCECTDKLFDEYILPKAGLADE